LARCYRRGGASQILKSVGKFNRLFFVIFLQAVPARFETTQTNNLEFGEKTGADKTARARSD